MVICESELMSHPITQRRSIVSTSVCTFERCAFFESESHRGCVKPCPARLSFLFAWRELFPLMVWARSGWSQIIAFADCSHAGARGGWYKWYSVPSTLTLIILKATAIISTQNHHQSTNDTSQPYQGQYGRRCKGRHQRR